MSFWSTVNLTHDNDEQRRLHNGTVHLHNILMTNTCKYSCLQENVKKYFNVHKGFHNKLEWANFYGVNSDPKMTKMMQSHKIKSRNFLQEGPPDWICRVVHDYGPQNHHHQRNAVYLCGAMSTWLHVIPHSNYSLGPWCPPSRSSLLSQRVINATCMVL